MKGGYRPNAGRPPGIKETKPRARRKKKEFKVDNQTEDKKPLAGSTENLDPLTYMLKVMNDPNESKDRRDRMAISSAPFVHRKGEGIGKKEAKADRAKIALSGKFRPSAPPHLKVLK